MPSGSKKRRKAAEQKKQQEQHPQTLPPTKEAGKGQKSSDSSSSSSDSDKELKQSEKISGLSKTEAVEGGIEDAEVVGKVGEDVRTVEVVESEVQWDVKEIGVEESSAAAAVSLADVAPVMISSESVEVAEGVGETVEALLDADALSHEIEVKPVPVFGEDVDVELPLGHESSEFVEKYVVSELSEGQESGGGVEKDSVSELPLSHESGSGGAVEIDLVTEVPQSYESGSGVVEKDLGSELVQSQVSGSGVVIEKVSVIELPQSCDSGSGGDFVENAPVGQLKQARESGGENSDRYIPTVGVTIEHQAKWWNCCGLLDVFMGSRDDGRRT